MKSTG